MYRNFENTIKEKGITAYAVAKETELSPVVFSDWKARKSKSKADKLLKFARFLGVLVEELIEEEK